MQQEIIRVNDLGDLQEEVPFLIFVPEEYKIENVTYRKEGRKWATLRYVCRIGSESLRVKQFFLDWFYTGFPKSLMESLVSSYSSIDSARKKDHVIFYGKDYKNMEASASFHFGTQIEIEGETRDGVTKLSENLYPVHRMEKFKNFPFYRRSFFARGGTPEWFEEGRISRLKWNHSLEDLKVRDLSLDSVGVLREKDRILESVLVFADDYCRRAMWIDSARTDSSVDHLFYEIRSGGNFFDYFQDEESIMAHKSQYGPGLYQIRANSKITTISFSPLFTLSEVKALAHDVSEMMEELENLI